MKHGTWEMEHGTWQMKHCGARLFLKITAFYIGDARGARLFEGSCFILPHHASLYLRPRTAAVLRGEAGEWLLTHMG